MRSPESLRAADQRRSRVPSPALVLSTIAVLGAIAAPVWASALLTGDDIRDATLTGKDIKDGSIGPSDMSRTGRAALAGRVGPTGATGPSGPAGVKGDTGPSGPTGAPGDAGPAGPKGEAGAKGNDGAIGATGPQGPTGATGLQGAVGPQGSPGADAIALWAEITHDASAGQGVEATGGGLDGQAPVTVMGSGASTVYAVRFVREVSACAALVTRRSELAGRPTEPDAEPVLLSDIDAEAGGSAYTFHDPQNAKRIKVRLLDASNQGTEGSFALALRCP